MLHRTPHRFFEIRDRDFKEYPTCGDHLYDTDVVSIVLDCVSHIGLSNRGFAVKLTNQDSLQLRRFRINGPSMDKMKDGPASFGQVTLFGKGGRVWRVESVTN